MIITIIFQGTIIIDLQCCDEINTVVVSVLPTTNTKTTEPNWSNNNNNKIHTTTCEGRSWDSNDDNNNNTISCMVQTRQREECIW